MTLTPKLKLVPTKPTKKGVTVSLTCTLDCAYAVTLDNKRTLKGTAVGGTKKPLVFKGALAAGRHVVTGSAVGVVNAGAAATVTSSFRVK
jgi:hypothetical protein